MSIMTCKPCVTVPAVCILIAGLIGCATPPSSGPVEPVDSPQLAPVVQKAATIVKVNEDLGYVILETAIAPAVGQEVDIQRKGKTVGVLRVTEDQDLPFVAADIVSGKAHMGDAVLLEPADTDDEANP